MDAILPFKKEFLLNLVNNNYSQRTLESYARDLLIFELFLKRYNLGFSQISKLNINEYKGYLKTSQHLYDLEVLKQNLKMQKQKKHEQLEDSTSKVEESESDLILDMALVTDVLKKTRSNGSKTNSITNTGLNSRSINRMLSSLRSYLNFLTDIDQDVPIPPNAIKMVKTEKKESQVADFDEIVALVEAPEKYEGKINVRYRNRAILELFFSTGMRISEVVNLDLVDLNWDDYTKKILDNKIYITGKGKKQRYVYLTDRCIHYIERYLEKRCDNMPALFLPYRGQRMAQDDVGEMRVSARYIQSIIKKYKRLLGILIPTTPHSLRHGFATYLAEKGANPAAIQRLLGHESLQTTTRYVHSSDKFAQSTHADFHPLSTE